MTPQEFKAWFDGFTEGFDGKTPTIKQWDRIKKRVKEINGSCVTERVFFDDYWPVIPRRRAYLHDLITCSSSANTVSNNATYTTGATSRSFDSLRAMTSLGRADAAALS